MLAFAITLLVGPGTIRYLYRLRFGQQIRESGPATHQKKSGTPTMGGVMIIVTLTIASLLFAGDATLIPYALFVTVGYGLIGLVDDFISVVAKRSLGLKARQKLLGQILIALLLAFFALSDPRLGSSVLIPFTGATWYMPAWLFVLLATGVVVGFANGVNITDGLDGLAAGSTAVAASVYAVVAYLLGSTEMAVFAAAVAGACLGFSW
jgi:phospho-N-acetylmuramoyl-pentapeptide-transferase